LVEQEIQKDGQTFGRGLAVLIIGSLGDGITELSQTETQELLESSIQFWSFVKRAKTAAGLPEKLAEIWDNACRTAFRDRFIEHIEYLRGAAELLGMDPSQAPKN
jgi:hypothetical protein